MGGSDNKGDGLASQPRRYQVPGQPLLNRHQVGGVSRSPDGLFAQQEQEPIRGRPAVRGKSTYGGRPGQRVEEQGTWASQKHSEAGYGRPVDRGAWTAKTVKRPRQQPAHPQYANYWAPLMRKRHTVPHSAQPQHTNYWAPRTWKRHQQEHRPQRPTKSSDPTQHAKGRTGDCPGPRKGATTRRNVTQGGSNKHRVCRNSLAGLGFCLLCLLGGLGAEQRCACSFPRCLVSHRCCTSSFVTRVTPLLTLHLTYSGRPCGSHRLKETCPRHDVPDHSTHPALGVGTCSTGRPLMAGTTVYDGGGESRPSRVRRLVSSCHLQRGRRGSCAMSCCMSIGGTV